MHASHFQQHSKSSLCQARENANTSRRAGLVACVHGLRFSYSQIHWMQQDIA